MILTTGPAVDGRSATEYIGLVSVQAILGINIGKDITAGFRNIIGGRSGAYEKEIAEAVAELTKELEAKGTELGADAIVSIDFDYESVGTGGMLMVAASGTAVKLS